MVGPGSQTATSWRQGAARDGAVGPRLQVFTANCKVEGLVCSNGAAASVLFLTLHAFALV